MSIIYFAYGLILIGYGLRVAMRLRRTQLALSPAVYVSASSGAIALVLSSLATTYTRPVMIAEIVLASLIAAYFVGRFIVVLGHEILLSRADGKFGRMSEGVALSLLLCASSSAAAILSLIRCLFYSRVLVMHSGRVPIVALLLAASLGTGAALYFWTVIIKAASRGNWMFKGHSTMSLRVLTILCAVSGAVAIVSVVFVFHSP